MPLKRFVLVYRDKAFPIRSSSVERIKEDITKAYVSQDASETVRFGGVSMSSADIANGNYTVLDLDEWFEMRKGPEGPSRS